MEDYINAYSLIGELENEEKELFKEISFQKIDILFEEKKFSLNLEFIFILLSFIVLFGSLFLLPLS